MSQLNRWACDSEGLTRVTIANIAGATECNGTFTILSVNSSTAFTVSKAFTSAYASGGTVTPDTTGDALQILHFSTGHALSVAQQYSAMSTTWWQRYESEVIVSFELALNSGYAASRINSNLNGRTNQFGWLQAPATSHHFCSQGLARIGQALRFPLRVRHHQETLCSEPPWKNSEARAERAIQVPVLYLSFACPSEQ